MVDHEAQPLLSTVRERSTNSNYLRNNCCGDIRFLCSRACLQHKAIVLILVWTMIVGELLALQQIAIGTFIEDYVPIGKHLFVNSVSSPLAFVYAILAVIAMFYPLSGFIADVCCGRFKTVMIGLSFLLFNYVALAVSIAWFGVNFHHINSLLQEYSFKEVAPFYFIGFCSFSLALLGIVAFQANFIQLGLDQLIDSPSKDLRVFVHLAIWANILGTTITDIGGAIAECPILKLNVRIGCSVVSILVILSIPFLLILTCCKYQWFNTEPGHRNPYMKCV